MLSQKTSHVIRDHLTIFFQCEVSGVEQVQLRVLQIALIGVCTFSREDRIVLAPHDQCRRLMGPTKATAMAAPMTNWVID
jgi:hypothetical protein